MQKETIGNTKIYVTYSTAKRARDGWREDVWVELKQLFDKAIL